jgi:hypothetical protein
MRFLMDRFGFRLGEEDTAIQFHSAPEEAARRLQLSIYAIVEMLRDGRLNRVEWAWRGFQSTVRMVKDGRSVVVFPCGLILEEGSGGDRKGDRWFCGFYVSDPRRGDVNHGNPWAWSRM